MLLPLKDIVVLGGLSVLMGIYGITSGTMVIALEK